MSSPQSLFEANRSARRPCALECLSAGASLRERVPACGLLIFRRVDSWRLVAGNGMLLFRLGPLPANSTESLCMSINIYTTAVQCVLLMRQRPEYDGLNININGTLPSRLCLSVNYIQ